MPNRFFQPKAYFALARTAFTNSFGYRGAMLLYAVAKIVTAFALFYLWQAIVAAGIDMQNYRLSELKIYLLFGLLTNMVLSFTAENRISRKVLDGSIAMDLLKPLDFQATCLAENIGMGLFEGFLGILIVLGVAIGFGGVVFPSDPFIVLILVLSLLLGLLVKFGIVYLAGLLCFWTESPLGIIWMRQAITNLFSGALMPLAFFPDWLRDITGWLPFQSIVHIPAQIVLGRTTDIGGLLGIQICWIMLLFIAGRLVWHLAIRRITIDGG